MSPPSPRDEPITFQLRCLPGDPNALLEALRGVNGVSNPRMEGTLLCVNCNTPDCANAVAMVLSAASLIEPGRWHDGPQFTVPTA